MNYALPTVTLPDGTTRKLGRMRPKARPMVPRLGQYVDLSQVQLPGSVDYYSKVPDVIRQMYGNDTLGDCVIASLLHALGLWSENEAGKAVIATAQDVQRIYFYFSPHDQGCVISQVLDYAVQTGVTVNGAAYKLDGYVALDWTNKPLLQFAIEAFGCVKIGINLPNAWANTEDGGVWDVTRTRFVGGHDVLMVGYDSDYVYVSTWGGIRKMTWAAVQGNTYVDEAYAMLSPLWYGPNGLGFSGFDAATLAADLKKVGQGQLPDFNPTPVPGPTPPPDPTPTPAPTPVPPSPTPAPKGLTQEQVVQAIKDGIAAGAPYGFFNVPGKVQSAAILGVQDAWPRSNRSPLPSEAAETLLKGR